MKGTTSRGTIHFKGLIQGHEIQILLDGGSSDNFIQPCIAKFLQLPIQEAPRFKVLVGNGHQLEYEGEVKHIPVHIQGYSIQVSTYVLPIAAVDLVLGTQWLAKLDTHLVNYRHRFVTFYLDGQLITFQGENQLLPSQAHFHHFKRVQSTEAIAELYTLQI